MAKLPNGPFGPLEGQIGNIIGSTWKGVPYYRSKTIRKKPFSPKELASQNRFALAERWLKPVYIFVKAGFNNNSYNKKGINGAKSYLMLNAFEGAGMETTVNPALVLVSKGALRMPDKLTATSDPAGFIRFDWSTENIGAGSAMDQIMMLAYDIDNRKAYFLTTGNFRYTGTDSLPVPKDNKGKKLHIYAAFSGADRLDQSDSKYLGVIAVAL